ncbi:MAG: hypothetical protein ABEK04_00970 [Candidatus Nanohalobium sp.]
MLGGLIGGSNQSGDADWSFEEPEKARQLSQDLVDQAQENGKEGVMALAEEKGLSREDAAAVIFKQARRNFEVIKDDIQEIQEVLNSEMERIEQETKQAMKKERSSSRQEEIERKADKILHQEEKRVQEVEEKIDGDLKEIEGSEETAFPLFKIAGSLTSREGRKADIKTYRSRVKKIEQYNILTDLQIEEEDVEKLVEELEDTLEKKDLSGKEPDALAEEVSQAIKKFSRDKDAVERLDFISRQ